MPCNACGMSQRETQGPSVSRGGTYRGGMVTQQEGQTALEYSQNRLSIPRLVRQRIQARFRMLGVDLGTPIFFCWWKLSPSSFPYLITPYTPAEACHLDTSCNLYSPTVKQAQQANKKRSVPLLLSAGQKVLLYAENLNLLNTSRKLKPR